METLKPLKLLLLLLLLLQLPVDRGAAVEPRCLHFVPLKPSDVYVIVYCESGRRRDTEEAEQATEEEEDDDGVGGQQAG
ncbi:hypothetical protein INR49_019252 [Caranx melampygus]|nr:hypothetical protein INR49_019252 [Caranx melampygus]